MNTKQSKFKNGARPIQRYLVMNVYEGVYKTDSGQQQPEKVLFSSVKSPLTDLTTTQVLLVEDEKSKLCKAITLRQSWYDTRCEKGAFVHVIGEFSRTGQCLIDDDHNMLVVHPDHLISATVVADSFGCLRRAVLQDRVKATSEACTPALYGRLLHEIFQEAMTANRWDSEWMSETIQMITERNLEEIYAVKLSMAEVKDHLESKMPEFRAWAQRFVRVEPRVSRALRVW